MNYSIAPIIWREGILSEKITQEGFLVSIRLIVRKSAAIFFSVSAFFTSMMACADGGISIQGTRIIYPHGAAQQSISVHNSSATDSFLVQSWIENADGSKSSDFVVIPPLYLSGPRNENILRIMKTGGNQPQDKESLYYFIAKAIPSIDDKKDADRSIIRIAAASRIKLFVRPSGLTPSPEKAPTELTFKRTGKQLEIDNPTPYYITLTEMKSGGRPIEGVMAAPKAKTSVSLSFNAGNSITFSTINDFGTVKGPITVEVK
ncbi:MAG: fimbria/pilus periplasmic chaperone [Kluyvera sp.]